MKKAISAVPPAPPEVGATLQRMRLERGLTLEDLSRTAGVSKSMLSQIEREKANPTIAVAWRLANALGPLKKTEPCKVFVPLLVTAFILPPVKFPAVILNGETAT